MHFADSLTKKTLEMSPICVGIDPIIQSLPEGISKDPQGIFEFGKGIIDAVKHVAPCIKPQSAYYELFRGEGMKVFWDTCTYAKEQGLLVIADVKRGDIGPTSEAYAEAYLGKDTPIDAVTLNPYCGSDTIKPFLERCAKYEKGIFILIKTSNPTSSELQDLPVGDEVLHEHLAQLVESWGQGYRGKDTGLSAVGAVIGATYPEELRYLRTIMLHTIFLIPGYGAQGGRPEDVRQGFLPGGTGAMVSASRSIIFASKGHDWKEAAANAAEVMAQEVRGILSSH